MEGLMILTNIALVLLLGLLCTVWSNKMKISNVMLLVFLGIFLQYFVVNGHEVFKFTPTFLVSVSILAIVMIVFDSTSRFRWKELDEISFLALKLTTWFTVANLFFLSLISMFVIYDKVNFHNYLYAMIFAVSMMATDPSSLFAMMGTVKNKTVNLLEVESVINTPLTVILPFVVLDLVGATGESIISTFLYQILPFLQQVVVGVGAGMVIGIIIFKVMKNVYSEQLSPIGLITAALLAFVLAEHMDGSGILAVATLGVFFGSIYVKQKSSLQEFSGLLSSSLEILVFVLVGMMISLPMTVSFFMKSIFLFAMLLLCRAGAVFFSLRNEKFKNQEKVFMILNIPKGIAMAVVVFTFTVLGDAALNQALDYMLAILIYSLMLSTVMTKNSKRFIKVDVTKDISS